MPRRQDKNKKQQILKASLEIFGANGFRGATIKDIAGRAGVAPGSLYTYFPDKEALFLACIEKLWSEFLEGMEKFANSDLPIEKKYLWFFDYGFDLLKKVHPLIQGMNSEVSFKFFLETQMDDLCAILEKAFSSDDKIGLFVPGDTEEIRQFIIRVIVGGIIFDTSMTLSENLDYKIEEFRQKMKAAFLMRFSIGQRS